MPKALPQGVLRGDPHKMETPKDYLSTVYGEDEKKG